MDPLCKVGIGLRGAAKDDDCQTENGDVELLHVRTVLVGDSKGGHGSRAIGVGVGGTIEGVDDLKAQS